jgi:pimeloyl-ACP methyl ester carboxylesterase
MILAALACFRGRQRASWRRGQTMKNIELPGGTIEYQDSGGNGPTLVLLHGLLMDASLLLIGAGFRRRSASQAIDLPSCGGVNLGRFFTTLNGHL